MTNFLTWINQPIAVGWLLLVLAVAIGIGILTSTVLRSERNRTETERVNKAIAVGCFLAGLLLAGGIGFVFYRVLAFPQENGFGAVALLILLGLGGFLGLISIISLISSWIGILDAKQAFGLPEGTVRAILTMAFIVIVGVLASYLLTNSKGSPLVDKENALTLAMNLPLTEAQSLMIGTPPTDGVLAIRPHEGTAAAPERRYDVVLFPRFDNRLAEDVSKQILTMLSTILAAMIGFYFGARPGESEPDSVRRAQAVAEIERAMTGLPDTADLMKRAQQLVDGKLKGDDQKEAREKLGNLIKQLPKWRETMDAVERASLSASTTAVEMKTSAASATSAGKNITAAKAVIEEFEKDK